MFTFCVDLFIGGSAALNSAYITSWTGCVPVVFVDLSSVSLPPTSPTFRIDSRSFSVSIYTTWSTQERKEGRIERDGWKGTGRGREGYEGESEG